MKMNPLARERARKGTLLMPESTLERQKTRRTLTTGALAEAGTSLAEIDWRLLHWLLRYPPQRVDDLGGGVARGASRATVYRHLQKLEEKGPVERVLAEKPGKGKR